MTGTVLPFPAQPPEGAGGDRCACGAPAALVTGYRGEHGPELQCARCATADPRMMLGSSWLGPAAGPLGRPAPDNESEQP